MQSWAGPLGWPSRRLRNYWVLVVCFSSACLLVVVSYGQYGTLLLSLRNTASTANASFRTPPSPAPEPSPKRVAIVVATQLGDDITWLDAFPGWTKSVYVTNDPTADLTVPVNKGREGMVYLTYIIDNYERLPETIIFSHSTRYQWHNDDPFYDGQAILERLNFSHIQAEGYISLRCCWTLGCPNEILPITEAKAPAPASDPTSNDARAGSFYQEAFEQLFPDTPVPETIGAHCCAQFAATAQQIRRRPVADYIRYRNWLLHTPLKDHLSGRILEYSWHVIFHKPPIHCPNAAECYCKLYGLCGLQCESEGVCGAAYTLPKYSTLPDGWPDYDWKHQWRNVTQLKVKYEVENRRPAGITGKN